MQKTSRAGLLESLFDSEGTSVGVTSDQLSGVETGACARRGNPITLLISENPVTVVLFLIHPTILVEWLGGEGGEHGPNMKWDSGVHPRLEAAEGELIGANVWLPSATLKSFYLFRLMLP